jgi:hypothetical protein
MEKEKYCNGIKLNGWRKNCCANDIYLSSCESGLACGNCGKPLKPLKR